MTIEILTQYDSPNYTTPEQMPYVGSGIPRTHDSYTFHHWNAPNLGDTFEGTIAELCRYGVGKSAHYVVEGESHGNGRRAACIVSPVNAAWSCGNWYGNASTIAFEMNPDECDSCYEAAGELLAMHWKDWGVDPSYPHNHWTGTTCPGTYDLNRIVQIAQRYFNGNSEDEFDMATIDDLVNAIKRPDVLEAIAGAVFSLHITSFDGSSQPVGAVLSGMRRDVHAAAGLLDAPILSWDNAQHPLRDVLTAQRTDVHVLRDALPAPVPVPEPVPVGQVPVTPWVAPTTAPAPAPAPAE